MDAMTVRPRVVPAMIRADLARLDQIEARTRDALISLRGRLSRARAERRIAEVRVLEGMVAELEAELARHIPAERAYLEARLAEIEGGEA